MKKIHIGKKKGNKATAVKRDKKKSTIKGKWNLNRTTMAKIPKQTREREYQWENVPIIHKGQQVPKEQGPHKWYITGKIGISHVREQNQRTKLIIGKKQLSNMQVKNGRNRILTMRNTKDKMKQRGKK